MLRMINLLFLALRVNSINLFNMFRYPFLAKGFLIPSHLTVAERICLFRLCKESGSSHCLEIGSYVGASAYFFSSALARNGSPRQLMCIDTWENDAMTEGYRDTRKDFKFHTQKYSKFIVSIRGYSTQVVDEVRQKINRLDLLFIDGDHSYEGVKADWEAYKGFLHSGSVIIFHDYGWAEGVRRVVHEDVLPHVKDPQQLPNMWWGTMGSWT